MSRILLYTIALVWLINGLFCKMLHLVPRHEQIVARILGEEYSSVLTQTIGFAEILIAIWVLSKFKSRVCTIVQIIVVAVMNVIEFILVPDLLLFGKWNALFAFMFILLVAYQEFWRAKIVASTSDK